LLKLTHTFQLLLRGAKSVLGVLVYYKELVTPLCYVVKWDYSVPRDIHDTYRTQQAADEMREPVHCIGGMSLIKLVRIETNCIDCAWVKASDR